MLPLLCHFLQFAAHALGPQPAETGLHQRFGWPIWMVRTGLEVAVVIAGWILGGNVGVGPVAFALLVGPLCQFFMRVFAVRVDGGEPRDATGELRVVG